MGDSKYEAVGDEWMEQIDEVKPGKEQGSGLGGMERKLCKDIGVRMKQDS